MKKVAVTGGLASGKTAACRFFGELGAYVLSADDLIHELYTPQSALGKKVVQLLGAEVVVDGAFDRGKIAQKVFRDYSLLGQLEQLLHPEVQKVIEARYQEVIQGSPPYPLFVVEVPLLFEGHLERFYDATVVVVAKEEACLARFKARGGNGIEYRLRAGRLIPMEEKALRAHFVVRNDEGLEELKKEIETIYQNIQ